MEEESIFAASHGQGLFYCHIKPLRRFARSGHQDEIIIKPASK